MNLMSFAPFAQAIGEYSEICIICWKKRRFQSQPGSRSSQEMRIPRNSRLGIVERADST